MNWWSELDPTLMASGEVDQPFELGATPGTMVIGLPNVMCHRGVGVHIRIIYIYMPTNPESGHFEKMTALLDFRS
jgi:hypothetical protein